MTWSTAHYQHILYIVAIVDCTHVGSATASFKDLVTVAQENTTNQAAAVLMEDQLQPPLDLVKEFPRSENSTNQTTYILQVQSLPNLKQHKLDCDINKHSNPCLFFAIGK